MFKKLILEWLGIEKIIDKKIEKQDCITRDRENEQFNLLFDNVDINYEKAILKYQWRKYKDLPMRLRHFLVKKYKLGFDTFFGMTIIDYGYHGKSIGCTDDVLAKLMSNIKDIDLQNSVDSAKVVENSGE